MSIGTAIHSLLSTDATFAGIMGSRIFPNTVPAKTSFPFTVYTIIGTNPTDDKDGVSPLDEVLIQLDIYSKSYDTAKEAATRSREVLDRYRNLSYSSALAIDRAIFDNEKEGDYDAEIGVYWTSQDWRIRLNRTAIGAVWFSQTFTGTATNSLTVTANSGNLPADDAIEITLNGQLITGWTRAGSIISLPFTTEATDVLVVRFRTLADGSTAFAQTFTNVTTNSVTVTENGGTLPADAAIDVYIQGLFTTDWTKTGSDIVFPYNLAGDTVEVQFRILAAGTAYRQTFTGITGYTLTLTNPLPTQLAAIKVHVNGVLSTEFSRTNSATITMNYELYPSDSITVTYYA